MTKSRARTFWVLPPLLALAVVTPLVLTRGEGPMGERVAAVVFAAAFMAFAQWIVYRTISSRKRIAIGGSDARQPVHHDAVTTNDPAAVVRGERERTLLIRCGVFVAFVGLALYQLDDNQVMDFLYSAMVFTGALMAFPMAVVQALEKSRTL